LEITGEGYVVLERQMYYPISCRRCITKNIEIIEVTTNNLNARLP
jgi:hypothetical protein